MSVRRWRAAAPATALAGVSTDAILESISDGVFTVDASWTITSFNRAAEQITGIPRAEALGRRCSEVLRASMCETACALRHTLDSGEPVVNRAAFIVDGQGRRIPISVSTALLRDADGQVVGGAETFRDLTVVEELRRELQGRTQVGDLCSRSAAMRRVLELLPRVADSDSTVLVQGETGTGKELVARALHGLSGRADGPFVALNCGALPDSLLESELFGYRAGAFTGATRDKPGRFALAAGGTLFLDEISEVSPAMQVRLLRVLQERRYEALGDTRTRRSDARVIAATNRDLSALVARGVFRQDLYYRVQVITIEVPPLRARRDDIPLLVERFIERFNAARDSRVQGLEPDAMAVLMAHDWPGNVRELQNAIEHAFVLCPEGTIRLAHLPPALVPVADPAAPRGSLHDAVAAVEAQVIRQALARCEDNRLAAARALGLHKSTLFRKAHQLGITLPERDGRSRAHRARTPRRERTG